MKDYVYRMMKQLERAGVEWSDAVALRRIAMALHRWFELECGIDGGWIERDDTTGFPYFHYETTGGNAKRHRVADREAGALNRLNSIMTRYPHLSAYVQTDPRGAALYIIRPGNIPEGGDVECFYTNGIAIYK